MVDTVQKAQEMDDAHQKGNTEFELGCHLYSKGQYVEAEQQLLAARRQAGAKLATALCLRSQSIAQHSLAQCLHLVTAPWPLLLCE